jgi:hypothetical protein
MAVQRSSYAKLQRDRAKKAKAQAKRERKSERPVGVDEVDLEGDALIAKLTGHDGPPTPDELLQLVGALHARFEANEIDFEEFEELKGALMRRLTVHS